jgi:hypothetical protein
MAEQSACESKKLRTLSLGAGVQSTTIALLAVHGEIEKPEHAIFADTGWEPKEVYEHFKWLKPIMEAAGIQVHVVTAGNIREETFTKKILKNGKANVKMPFFVKHDSGGSGLITRQCTFDYKVTPIVRKQRELIGVGYGQKWKEENGEIINMMGISLDEIQRAKDNRVPYITNEFPLLELRMKRHDCQMWLKEHGYSAPRSACIGCPYHSDKEWRRIKENPVEWADAVDFDHKLRTLEPTIRGKLYLHSSCKPLDEVDLRSEEELGQGSLFGAECEGMCGL